MAMPVLNERMSESALLAAGARGENSRRQRDPRQEHRRG